MFGEAGVVAVYGGGAMVAAAVAGVLTLAGRKRVGRAAPPMPEKATASVKADAREIKDHFNDRRHYA